MKHRLIIAVLIAVTGEPLYAQSIDLDCEAHSKQLIERLSAEGLLAERADSGQRARVIGMELCSGAEVTAQEQYEAGKQEALDNWFLEKRPDKPGNKRLRNLKR